MGKDYSDFGCLIYIIIGMLIFGLIVLGLDSIHENLFTLIIFGVFIVGWLMSLNNTNGRIK